MTEYVIAYVVAFLAGIGLGSIVYEIFMAIRRKSC